MTKSPKEVTVSEWAEDSWSYTGSIDVFPTSSEAMAHAAEQGHTVKLGLSLQQQEMEKKLGIDSDNPRLQQKKQPEKLWMSKPHRWGYTD